MDEVILWFKSTSLTFITHEYGRRSTPLIGDWSVYFNQIGDQLELISSLKESLHYKSLSDVSSLYEKKVLLLNHIMLKLNEVQRKWLYLEPIYGSGTMTLKQELFDNVDVAFRAIMARNRNSKLKNLVDEDLNPNLNTNLDIFIKDLEQCQQCLSKFLEDKRYSFSRLYFLGDEALLEMLGHSKQPETLQTHMKHLFQAIHTLVFDQQMSNIVAFQSAYGEEVELQQV